MFPGFSSSVATPGTPQRLTAGASPALPTVSGVLSGTITPYGRSVVVQNNPTSTGNLYVGGPTLNVSTGAGAYAVLSPGASWTSAIESAGDIGTIFVDTNATAKYNVSFN